MYAGLSLISVMAVLLYHRVGKRSDAVDRDLGNLARDHGRRLVCSQPQHVAGAQRDVAGHHADEVVGVEEHVAGGEGGLYLAVDPYLGGRRKRVGSGDDPRPHRLERVTVLAAPERAVAALPAARADVVPDRPAEHRLLRLVPRAVPDRLADDGDQLTLGDQRLVAVGGPHDRRQVPGQRVVGAVPHLRPGRHRVPAIGGTLRVPLIVQPRAEEGPGDHGRQPPHVRGPPSSAQLLICPERSPADWHHVIAFYQPVPRPPGILETAPDHGRSLWDTRLVTRYPCRPSWPPSRP